MTDPLKEALLRQLEDKIDTQGAYATLAGFLSHMDAAVLAGNDAKADRERASAVAAFEAMLDLRIEQSKRLLRTARRGLEG